MPLAISGGTEILLPVYPPSC